MPLGKDEMLFSGRITRPAVRTGAAHPSFLVLRRRRNEQPVGATAAGSRTPD